MKFFKENNKLIFSIIIDVFICIVAFLILSFYLSNNTTVQVSTESNLLNNNNTTKENILIADLNNEANKNEEITEIVTDEKASNKELKDEKVNKKEEQKSTSPYYIKVNNKANVVTIYTKDKDGKYTVPYKAMVCSTGTYTPRSGTYKISNKYRWGKLIHDVYGQYATRIVGDILFHSVPYSSNSADSLLYKEYDKLGTAASAGCVRLTIKDCKWIYDNCPRGTMVEFYKSSEPGPLGKPTAQKISDVEECRNWDPTDPASNNPWHTYKPEEEQPSTDTSNTITNNVTNNVINESANNPIISNNVIQNSTITNNTTVNSSIITNNTINNTNSITNNTITDTNNVVNNSVSNNVANNNTTDFNNNIINNTTTNNTIQNNNSTIGNNNISNNTVHATNNVTSNNITVPNTNNLIVNNIV